MTTVRDHGEAAPPQPADRVPAVGEGNDLVTFAPDDQRWHRQLREEIPKDLPLAGRADHRAQYLQSIPEEVGAPAEPVPIGDPTATLPLSHDCWKGHGRSA